MRSQLATDFPSLTWGEALREFLLHLQATRAEKTRRFYDVQLRQLVLWTAENDVPFDQFGKRHLDRYLVHRAGKGLSPTTLHSDALCAKAFLRWCVKNDLLERSLLAEYEIRKAPAPARYMPSDEEIRGLLRAVHDYWDPAKNPDVRYHPVQRRIFHRDRNTAILIGLLDSACRIGELLHLRVDDYRPQERQITIRESKGREPRTLPVSEGWAEALAIWLKVRAKIMADAPKGGDHDWLFVSEYGGMVDPLSFLKAIKRGLRRVGLSENITLHSLRRFSLNRLAKHNLLAVQSIAGHKEPKTTLLYTKLDPDFVRDIHDTVGVVKGILGSKRPDRRKKLV